MQNFIYDNSSKIIFGSNDEAVLASEIKNSGAKKVLIHYGKNSVAASGLLDRIKNALDKEKIDYIEFGGVSANPLKAYALQGVDVAVINKIDFVLAVGGGSVIDSAKLICAGAQNKNIWNYYTKEAKGLTKALPLGVVLTIPAAGSECSPTSVIRDGETGAKYTLAHKCLISKFAFVNPEYCLTLPKEQIAYGASDILAHLLERYFSPERNVFVTDKLLSGAISAVFEIAPKVYKNPRDYQNMSEFCLLGTMAHNGMLALGRVVQAWESHPIEMAVCSGASNLAHGQGLAIIFPAWLKYMSKKRPEKVLQFARDVMCAKGKTNAEIMQNGIKKLEKFFVSLGLPVTLNEVGISVENAKKIVNSVFPKDVKLGGYGKLSIKDIENIVTLAK